MSDPKAKPALAFIGLGAMGGPMCRNLLRADFPVTAFDIDAERLADCAAEGAAPCRSAADASGGADFVLTSLPDGDVYVQVAENDLLPGARPGQVFIDLGTAVPAETRRLASAFAATGAAVLDVPVSGGPRGAEAGTLRMFAGGGEAVFAHARPILEVLGDPQRIVYCGPSGTGQIAKGVNQLAMGLGNAAYLEAIAFGVRAGVRPEALRVGVGGEEGWRALFDAVLGRIAQERGQEIGVKFGQLAYFLSEARQKDFKMPMARALHAFCDAGQRRVMEVNRWSPSFWHELMTRKSDD